MDCDLISFFPQVKAAFDKALARLVVLRKEIVPLHKKLQAEQARLAKEGFLSFKGKWPLVSAGACPLETASEANSNMHVASVGRMDAPAADQETAGGEAEERAASKDPPAESSLAAAEAQSNESENAEAVTVDDVGEDSRAGNDVQRVTISGMAVPIEKQDGDSGSQVSGPSPSLLNSDLVASLVMRLDRHNMSIHS